MERENKYDGAILLTPEQLGQAREGFVVAKGKGGKLVLVDPSRFSDAALKKAEEALEAVARFDAFTRHVKHFRKLCKSHFVNAFALWKTKVMEGELEVADESLLRADDAVLNGDKTVGEALAENPQLDSIFVRIYGEYSQADDGDGEIAFPEV